MKRKIAVLTLGAMLYAPCSAVEAQPVKIPRIGVLAGSSSAGESPRVEAFRQGLRDLGYVEDKNIAIEYRYADAKFDKLPALADELIRLKVEVLVVSTTPAVQAAKNATRTIPIVFLACLILLLLGWSTVWRSPGETSRDSPTLRQRWPANDWSCSKKPFPSSPALRCCMIRSPQALSLNGTKANSRHENWVCDSIRWR
jgi:hypothetical protein